MSDFAGLDPLRPVRTGVRGRAGGESLQRAVLAGVALAAAISLALPAEAAPFGSPRAKSSAKRDGTNKNQIGDMPKGPIQLVVSIADQRVTLYSNGTRVAQAPVSTGTPGHPTPMGVFSIIQKDRWHRSNLYQSAPMYFMQRLTWSGVALHEGYLPGYPASHGCIRMPREFAVRLWGITRLGVRVVVARHDVVPHDFDHPKLFVAKPRPAEPPLAETPVEKRAAVQQPIRFASAMPASTGEDASEAVPGSGLRRSLTDELPAGGPVSAEAVDASESAPAQDPLDVPAPSEHAKEASPQHVEQGAGKPVEVETTATVVEPIAATPAEPDKPAVDETAEPPKPMPPTTKTAEPQKLSGQVAVFVSRKEKKIFVRQGFVPLFDMPIEIADPDRPLGTHVFTALEVRDGGPRMRWNAITVPTSADRAAERSGRSGKKASVKEPAKPVVASHPPSSAAEALDRIQIPPEALDRIGEILIPGSSLLISDQGLGGETGRYTEFIVLTR